MRLARSKLLNACAPDAADERALNRPAGRRRARTGARGGPAERRALHQRRQGAGVQPGRHRP